MFAPFLLGLIYTVKPPKSCRRYVEHVYMPTTRPTPLKQNKLQSTLPKRTNTFVHVGAGCYVTVFKQGSDA